MYRFGHYPRLLRGIVTTPLPVTAGGNPMGSRGRSIRLRIYFLVAIPLVTMLGLFSYVAYGSITNFENLDRAPNLIQSTGVPMAYYLSTMQAERRAAFVY